jgi:hypothetical protein
MNPNWAEIGTAIGTVSAVTVALFSVICDSRRRLKEEERKQAERITGWMDFLPQGEKEEMAGTRVKLILYNASNQLVYNLIASVVNANTEEHVGDTLSYRNYIGRLPPNKTEYTIDHPGWGMHKRFSIELAFVDAGGRTWVRRGKGGLKQVFKEPLAFYGIDPPVGWQMP